MNRSIESQFETHCKGGVYDYIDPNPQYNPKDIIFRPIINKMHYVLLIINRETNGISFLAQLIQTFHSNRSQCLDHCLSKGFTDCESSYCFVPKFVEKIPNDLLRKIDGITDYRDQSLKISGHLILFNINGKPFFCFTPSKEDLSIDVLLINYKFNL